MGIYIEKPKKSEHRINIVINESRRLTTGKKHLKDIFSKEDTQIYMKQV